ncbi:MAG: hypothetical protein ACOCZD_02000 [Haloferacaceae archaeon]
MIRFKPVPAPPDRLGDLEPVRRAVPLVPAGEIECRRRLARRVGIEDRDEALAWLTFMRALGVVDRTDRGYRRIHDEPTPAALRDRFRRRVYGATEALAALSAADEPLTASAVAAHTADVEPAWERRRSADPTRAWEERTGRLLGWCLPLGLVDRVGLRGAGSHDDAPAYRLTGGGSRRP